MCILEAVFKLKIDRTSITFLASSTKALQAMRSVCAGWITMYWLCMHAHIFTKLIYVIYCMHILYNQCQCFHLQISKNFDEQSNNFYLFLSHGEAMVERELFKITLSGQQENKSDLFCLLIFVFDKSNLSLISNTALPWWAVTSIFLQVTPI